MPLCKIRTSRLNYREIYRSAGLHGFPMVVLLKLLGRDFPEPGRYLAPCFWADMQVASDVLSDEVCRHLRIIHSKLPASERAWECHYFQRPHRSHLIADSGGAFFFASGSRFSLTHMYVRAANGFAVNCTYVASFRQNGHTIATTNNAKQLDSVPGSECRILACSPEILIQQHCNRISTQSDLTTFHSFREFTVAYDWKEKLQSDWDFARGAYAPSEDA